MVGEIFARFPHIVKIFQRYECEFEIHSYTHNPRARVAEEMTLAHQAYCNYFHANPSGFRAPQGRLAPEMVAAMQALGIRYDSSIFPSYYPNPARYLFMKRSPHRIKGTHLIEIPLTSITPLRITLSLSYLKLLGMKTFLLFFRMFQLPETICFNIHLHDFIVNEDSYAQLSPFWKFVYGRNKYAGLDFFESFLGFIKTKGYNFCFVSDIYKQFDEHNQ